MKASWTQPVTFNLAGKLSELNARLQEIVPRLVEAQVEAVKRMADTVVALKRGPEEKLDE